MSIRTVQGTLIFSMGIKINWLTWHIHYMELQQAIKMNKWKSIYMDMEIKHVKYDEEKDQWFYSIMFYETSQKHTINTIYTLMNIFTYVVKSIRIQIGIKDTKLKIALVFGDKQRVDLKGGISTISYYILSLWLRYH